jgi:hypothetical protein
MSILDKLVGNVAGIQHSTRIKSVDVAERIEKAKADLHALQLRFMPAALEADDGDQGSIDALAELNAAIVAVEQTIKNLTAAHVEAVKIEKMAHDVALQNTFHSQAAAIRSHLSIAKKAAEDYSAFERDRLSIWLKLVTSTAKAKAAASAIAGFKFEEWNLDIKHLKAAVEREAYRVGAFGDPVKGNRSQHFGLSLPGYGDTVKSPTYIDDPVGIKPLAEIVAEACDRLSEHLSIHKAKLEGNK